MIWNRRGLVLVERTVTVVQSYSRTTLTYVRRQRASGYLVCHLHCIMSWWAPIVGNQRIYILWLLFTYLRDHVIISLSWPANPKARMDSRSVTNWFFVIFCYQHHVLFLNWENNKDHFIFECINCLIVTASNKKCNNLLCVHIVFLGLNTCDALMVIRRDI